MRPSQNYEVKNLLTAINIPIAQINNLLVELPKDKLVLFPCFKDYTSHIVCQILPEKVLTMYTYASTYFYLAIFLMFLYMVISS